MSSSVLCTVSCFGVLLLLIPTHVFAAPEPGAETFEASASPEAVGPAPQPSEAREGVATAVASDMSSADLEDLLAMLAAQRNELEEQNRRLAAQEAELAAQKADIQAQTGLLVAMERRLDELGAEVGKARIEPTAQELEMREQLQDLQVQLANIPEDPTAAMTVGDFPGSLRIPGTETAFKLGGFTKFNIVKSFDPVASTDRFIVGSIPVEATDVAATGSDASLTANQSRLNFDFREATSLGQFRGFIEADFAGLGDTFRLRHAYGQFRDLLAGKSWSVFYDPQLQPEEVDFEGINGIVSLRQSQIRFFPAIGKKWDVAISAEDPVAEVTDINYDFDPDDPLDVETTTAISNSTFPDLVASARFTSFGGVTLRTALVYRQLDAISTVSAEISAKTDGWGFNVGGTIGMPFWNENDNLKFQIVIGRGIGRYINDTNTVGGLDAVFGPSGQLKALPIWSGFAAYQHWWGENLRSTALLSLVEVDNFDFQPGTAYKRTERASINLLWSPITRIDVGGELLWGRRINKNDNSGSALQVQLQAKYRL